MKEVVAYKCEHCRKVSENKAYIKYHEKKCYYNPETKSCATCRYLIFGYKENPETGHYNFFQNCSIGLDVKSKHLKTECCYHDVRPEDYEEIEYISIFQGPLYIKAEKPVNT